MNALFLDTSGWLAVIVRRDLMHKAAAAGYEAAARAGHRLVTTSLVIAETHSLVLHRRGVEAGRDFLATAFNPMAHHVVYPDEEIVAAARHQWIRRFGDQSFSLCDAVSFEVMRRERITKALSADRHFAIAGFDILS